MEKGFLHSAVLARLIDCAGTYVLQVHPDLLDLLRCSCSWRLELVAAEVDVLRAHLDQCLGIAMNDAGAGSRCSDQVLRVKQGLPPQPESSFGSKTPSACSA